MSGRWRPLAELRAAFAASGIVLTRAAPGCKGKIRYARLADADLHLETVRERGTRGAELEHPHRLRRFHAYWCAHCGGYHVGHYR